MTGFRGRRHERLSRSILPLPLSVFSRHLIIISAAAKVSSSSFQPVLCNGVHVNCRSRQKYVVPSVSTLFLYGLGLLLLKSHIQHKYFKPEVNVENVLDKNYWIKQLQIQKNLFLTIVDFFLPLGFYSSFIHCFVLIFAKYFFNRCFF